MVRALNILEETHALAYVVKGAARENLFTRDSVECESSKNISSLINESDKKDMVLYLRRKFD